MGARLVPGAIALVLVLFFLPTARCDDLEGMPLREIHKERFQAMESIPGRFGCGYRARALDAEGNADLELVIPDDRGDLVIFPSSGAEPKRVKLEQKGGMCKLCSFDALRKDGLTYWFISTRQPEPAVGLYDSDGKRLWSRTIGERGTVCTKHVATGDLDGDGEPELVFAWEPRLRRAMGEESEIFARGAYISICDFQGSLVSHHRVGDSIWSMDILPAPEEGERATVVCSLDQVEDGKESIKGFQWMGPSTDKEDFVEAWTVSGRDFILLDLDHDEAMEMVSRDCQGNLAIRREGVASAHQVRFPTTHRSEGAVDYLPVRSGGTVLWYASVLYSDGKAGTVTTLGLYEPSGKAVWRWMPEVRGGASPRVQLSTLDLDGDGRPEMMAGVTQRGDDPSDTPVRADIVVFDKMGVRTAEIQVGKEITYLGGIPCRGPNRPAILVCVSDDKLMRFRYRTTRN